MPNDLWTRLVAWTGTLVAPDWSALVALIPLLLLLVVGAFAVVTSFRWAKVGRPPGGVRRQLPLAADGRPLRRPVLGPILLACAVFAIAFGLVAGPVWLAAGLALAVAALAAWPLEVRLARPRLQRGAPTTSAG